MGAHALTERSTELEPRFVTTTAGLSLSLQIRFSQPGNQSRPVRLSGRGFAMLAVEKAPDAPMVCSRRFFQPFRHLNPEFQIFSLLRLRKAARWAAMVVVTILWSAVMISRIARAPSRRHCRRRFRQSILCAGSSRGSSLLMLEVERGPLGMIIDLLSGVEIIVLKI